MNSLFRPLLRSSFSRLPHALRHVQPIRLHSKLNPASPASHLHIRSVASLVSGRPGSQTLDHAATNVKEELGNSAADLAKVIAGANVSQDAISNSSSDSFVS